MLYCEGTEDGRRKLTPMKRPKIAEAQARTGTNITIKIIHLNQPPSLEVIISLIPSPPPQRAHPLQRLEILLLRHVLSTHRRSALVCPFWSLPRLVSADVGLDCSSETTAEGRNIVAVGSSVCLFGSTAVSTSSASSFA